MFDPEKILGRYYDGCMVVSNDSEVGVYKVFIKEDVLRISQFDLMVLQLASWLNENTSEREQDLIALSNWDHVHGCCVELVTGIKAWKDVIPTTQNQIVKFGQIVLRLGIKDLGIFDVIFEALDIRNEIK